MGLHLGQRIGVPILLACLPVVAAAEPVIGVLGTQSEIATIEARLHDRREAMVRHHVFRVGTIGGRQVVVGRSGTGKVNAALVATLLIDHFAPVALLVSGTAGGLDPALHPGDVVIGATAIQHDVGTATPSGLRRHGTRSTVTNAVAPAGIPAPDWLLNVARQSALEMTLPRIRTATADRVPRIIEGVTATGDVFVADEGLREELRRTLGASTVDMEGGAIMHVCRQLRASCLVVSGVSDRADMQAHKSYREFGVRASENAAALVIAIIRKITD